MLVVASRFFGYARAARSRTNYMWNCMGSASGWIWTTSPRVRDPNRASAVHSRRTETASGSCTSPGRKDDGLFPGLPGQSRRSSLSGSTHDRVLLQWRGTSTLTTPPSIPPEGASKTVAFRFTTVALRSISSRSGASGPSGAARLTHRSGTRSSERIRPVRSSARIDESASPVQSLTDLVVVGLVALLAYAIVQTYQAEPRYGRLYAA
jgi:hypothetical protein